MSLPSSVERRAKRLRSRGQHAFLITCAVGIENMLADEVAQLGGDVRAIEVGTVAATGSTAFAYEANCRLRTAHRVWLQIATFWAGNLDAFRAGCFGVPWELYVGNLEVPKPAISSRKSRLHTGDTLGDIVLDAIGRAQDSAGLTAKGAMRPTDAVVRVRLFRDRVSIWFNTSGDLLHKRGLRRATGRAMVRETLAAAAALVVSDELRRAAVVVDPFCGSGTMLLEALGVAAGAPPFGRRGYLMEASPLFSRRTLEYVRRSAAASSARRDLSVIGVDIVKREVDAASLNLEARSDLIARTVLREADSSELNWASIIEGNGPVVIVSNIPYGRRVAADHQHSLRAMQAVATAAGRGSYSVISTDAQLISKLGWPLDHQVETLNGGIRVNIFGGTFGH